MLLLDEPTSALDPELVNEVLEVIRRLAVEDGLTMIISTHQLRFADEVADRVVFLSGGSIIEEGPAHEVLTNPRNPLTARFLSVMEADKPTGGACMTRRHAAARISDAVDFPTTCVRKRQPRPLHEAPSPSGFAGQRPLGLLQQEGRRRP